MIKVFIIINIYLSRNLYIILSLVIFILLKKDNYNTIIL